MAVIRQQNWLGQQRVDVPHLRAIESGVAGDFDVLAGNLIAGRTASVAKGFKLIWTAGAAANTVQLDTAGSILVHYEASETGSVFQVPADRAKDTLNNSNSRVSGGWTNNATNYVGIDLVRSADSTTADTIMVLDPTTNQETPQIAPLARTLDYKIVISTANFSATSGIAPVARVVLSPTGTIDSVTDCRSMLFSLASGGDSADLNNVYSWPNGRAATPASFSNGGDKTFSSLKDWMQGVMTRIWELGGGEKWYSQTADRNIVLCFDSPGSGLENFTWNLGTNTLTWEGLSVIFDNSTSYYNPISDGSATLTSDGQCLYVDLDRSTNSTLTASTGTLATLSGGSVPGSRFIIAVRQGNKIFVRNQPWAVGATLLSAATESSYGLVKLTIAPVGDSIVPFVDSVTGQAVCEGLTRKGLGAGDLTIGGDANDESIAILPKAGETAYVTGDTNTLATTLAGLGVAPFVANNDNAVGTTTVASFWGMASGQFAGAFIAEGSIAIPRASGAPGALTDQGITSNGLGCKLFVRNSPAISAPNYKLQLCVKWPGASDAVVLAESPIY